MKVLLITPYIETENEIRTDFLPSGSLLSLAAILRENKHEPIVMDFNNKTIHETVDRENFCINKILDTIHKNNLELVGISCLFSGYFKKVSKYASIIKEKFPNIKVIVGGIHVSTYPMEILENCLEFDYIALGEGEKQIIEVTKSIENKDISILSKIKSFAYRIDNSNISINKERDWLNYEELPMQAWDMIKFEDYEMDLSNYTNLKNHEIKNVIPVISERGCPFKCTFCDMYIVQGRKVRRRSSSKFVDELEYLVKERGQKFFTFMDDNLTVNNKHILEICEEILKRKLDIQFTTAGGLGVSSLKEEVISAMVEAGMTSALIAPEHGSDYIRNEIIKKNLNRDTIYEVVENLKKHKVSLAGNWIMGFPEDTHETLQEMMNMINELKLDRNWVGTLIPFPGTPVFEQCVRDKLFIEDVKIDELWKTPMRAHQSGSVIKPYSLSINELQEWREKFINIRFKYMRKF